MNQNFMKHILVDDGSHPSTTSAYNCDIGRVKADVVFNKSVLGCYI